MRSSGSTPVARQLPPASRSQSSVLQNLSKITDNDIKMAERFSNGPFGDIYVLNHASIGKLALKHMRAAGNKQEADSHMRRATREAETWRKLVHANILPFLDVLERSGQIYLVSPFVQNGTLISYVRRHPNIDRARLIHETAAGIAYLHRHRIIHGDIKGANILVSDDIRALICDFGLSRKEQSDISAGLAGFGTIRWQSPELLRGGIKTFMSDVWAFGMTIFEVLSGVIPYHQHKSSYAMVIAVVNDKERPLKEPASSPTGISYAPLWEIAGDCWHEDPAKRPEIQEVYDRQIFGSFRSLLLSPPSGDSTDALNDVQVVPSPSALSPSPSLFINPQLANPSTNTMVNNRTHPDPGLVNTAFENASEMTYVGQGQTPQHQASPSRHNDGSKATFVKPHILPKGAMIGRHGKVYAVGFSPDGRIIATGSDDHTLRLWSVEGRIQKGGPLEGHNNQVSCLGFSPAGTTLASGSHDRTLQLWDVASGYQKGRQLKGHTRGVTCLAFSPDGAIIASGSMDKTIRFWDPETGSQRGRALKGHTNLVLCLAFSPDGTTVASGSVDATIRLWGTGTGRQQSEILSGHSKAVTCLAFSPDGATIASGSWDKTIRFWDADAQSQRGEPLDNHASVVECLAFLPGSTTIAVGSGDRTVRFWDVENRSQRGKLLEGHTGAVRCLSFSPDSMNIASGSSDGTIRLWGISQI